ncbi:chromate transporter [Xanthobacteraceae bacterium Astr-EGSB]|uniref:chromate transporter n=1 Tax=Astrobacterium formosum TaxID=3069710 RepID=UPI0027B0B820|nr:chromate transporter [Xanthobacteraceae bacterium Astr-EGSB]
MSAPSPSITAIFLVFFRIGLLSFGGGLIGWVFREVVLIRHWLEEDEFLSGMALGQILPGANIANLTIFVGQRLRGLAGAAAGLFGLLVGPFFAVLALAAGYRMLQSLPHAEDAMEGVAAAAVGLLIVIVARGARSAMGRPSAALAFLATFAAVGIMHWSLLLVVAVVGPLSVWAAWPKGA